jgi:hypothetical protein
MHQADAHRAWVSSEPNAREEEWTYMVEVGRLDGHVLMGEDGDGLEERKLTLRDCGRRRL